MNEKITCRIDGNLKEDYYNHISTTYDQKWGKTGSELGKALKVYLTLKGSKKYKDDPDVLTLLNNINESVPTRTHTTPKNVAVSNTVEKDLVEEIKSLKAEVKQLRAEVKGKPSKKTGSLAEFKKHFRAEYSEYKQVSRRDIVRFVTDNYGVCDSRAIKNRIDFLIAHEVIEPFAQNVYNIML